MVVKRVVDSVTLCRAFIRLISLVVCCSIVSPTVYIYYVHESCGILLHNCFCRALRVVSESSHSDVAYSSYVCSWAEMTKCIPPPVVSFERYMSLLLSPAVSCLKYTDSL